MTHKYRFIFLASVACLLFAAGCGPNQKLTGKVTFPDGEPLTTGTVIFTKPGFISRSFIHPDGSFKVGTVKEGDGIPPGTYKVYIIQALAPVDPDDPESDAMKPLIDEKFASEDMTPLEITIPGEKSFDITVERAASKK